MLCVKKGTTGYAVKHECDADEVEFVGDYIMLSAFATGMIWDDKLQNIRPLTQDEIASQEKAAEAARQDAAKVKTSETGAPDDIWREALCNVVGKLLVPAVPGDQLRSMISVEIDGFKKP